MGRTSKLCWRASEIDAWIDSRFDARPAEPFATKAKPFTALTVDEHKAIMAKPPAANTGPFCPWPPEAA